MAPVKWSDESNPDWWHLRAQIEQALDWYAEWDRADPELYSPMEDAELIITLGNALGAIAEHHGITTLIYGVGTP